MSNTFEKMAFVIVTLVVVAVMIVLINFNSTKDSDRNDMVKGKEVEQVLYRENGKINLNPTISKALSYLEPSNDLGSAGHPFEKCSPDVVVKYKDGTKEILSFFTRQGLPGCVLAKSSLHYSYYSATRVLKNINAT